MKVMDNQRGFIRVSNDLLAATPDVFERYFADFEVLEVRDAWDVYHPTEKIYLCKSAEFEPVEEGSVIPFYVFTFHRTADGTITREPAVKAT